MKIRNKREFKICTERQNPANGRDEPGNLIAGRFRILNTAIVRFLKVRPNVPNTKDRRMFEWV